MQNTVRTTIRIREDLLKQSKLLAVYRDTSLQEIINNLLVRGLNHISDIQSHRRAMAKIDAFRESLRGKKINVEKLLEESKKDLK